MKFMRGLLLFAWVACVASAVETPLRFEDIFAPLRTEVAALSPDGRHVAYSLREAGSIYIVTVAIDHPEQAIARVFIADDTLAEGWHEPDYSPGKGRSRIRWMQWVTPTRIAVETNLTFMSMREPLEGAIYVFDFDGTEARRLFTAKSNKGSIFAQRLNPANETEILAESERDAIRHTTKSGVRWRRELIAINIDSGKSRKLKKAEVAALPDLIKAREQQSREFGLKVREELKKLLPDHQLTVLNSGPSSSTRALVRAQSVADPGGFLVYEPSANRLWDFVRRTDFLPPERQFKTDAFEFKNADGHLFSGLITLPLNPRILKAPLVVMILEKPGRRTLLDYRPDIHAFAAMGFAVAVVDGYHASNGLPLTTKISETDERTHLAQSIEIISDHYAVSGKAVALYGEDLAGRRAIDLVASRPGYFRCLVALAPYEISPEIETTLRKSKQKFVDSALILAWPGPKPTQGPSASLAMASLALGTMKDQGTETRFVRLSDSFHGQKPAARAEAFRTIEAFLIEHLYHYSVKIGETIELEKIPAEASP